LKTKYEEAGEEEVIINRETRYLQLKSEESEIELPKEKAEMVSHQVLVKPKLISDSRHVKSLAKNDSKKSLSKDFRHSRSKASFGIPKQTEEQNQKDNREFVKNEIDKFSQDRPHKRNF
jgi:hypothetical protein